MKKLLVLLATSLTFIGCKSALKTIKGIKDPQLESYASTNRYLFKNDVDTMHVLYFKDLASFAAASKKKLLQVPNALFFDKSGNFVDYRKTVKDCNAEVETFINDLSVFNDAKKDSTKTINELEKFVFSPYQIPIKKTGITVFITWARWSGSLNREKAFDWVKLIEKAKQRGISINYYLLNCDFQENWNMTTAQKRDLGFN